MFVPPKKGHIPTFFVSHETIVGIAKVYGSQTVVQNMEEITKRMGVTIWDTLRYLMEINVYDYDRNVSAYEYKRVLKFLEIVKELKYSKKTKVQ